MRFTAYASGTACLFVIAHFADPDEPGAPEQVEYDDLGRCRAAHNRAAVRGDGVSGYALGVCLELSSEGPINGVPDPHDRVEAAREKGAAVVGEDSDVAVAFVGAFLSDER